MKVMVRYGLHTYYRPPNWGDGSNEAHWGTASNSVKPVAAVVATLVAATQVATAHAAKTASARKAQARLSRA